MEASRTKLHANLPVKLTRKANASLKHCHRDLTFSHLFSLLSQEREERTEEEERVTERSPSVSLNSRKRVSALVEVHKKSGKATIFEMFESKSNITILSFQKQMLFLGNFTNTTIHNITQQNNSGQEYSQVVRMLGNGRCECFCFDGVTRLGHIRGKMRKKVWITAGDIVLVALREFQDEKVDIIHKYTADEARNLKQYGELPENARINETAVDMAMGNDGDDDEDLGISFDDI